MCTIQIVHRNPLFQGSKHICYSGFRYWWDTGFLSFWVWKRPRLTKAGTILLRLTLTQLLMRDPLPACFLWSLVRTCGPWEVMDTLCWGTKAECGGRTKVTKGTQAAPLASEFCYLSTAAREGVGRLRQAAKKHWSHKLREQGWLRQRGTIAKPKYFTRFHFFSSSPNSSLAHLALKLFLFLMLQQYCFIILFWDGMERHFRWVLNYSIKFLKFLGMFSVIGLLCCYPESPFSRREECTTSPVKKIKWRYASLWIFQIFKVDK